MAPSESAALMRALDLDDIDFIQLTREDINAVKDLDKLLFPVRYSDMFYDALLDNPRFTRIAVCHDRQTDERKIIGVVSSRLVYQRAKCRSFFTGSLREPPVGYISTLGVTEQYRRQGIARQLLATIISELHPQCTDIYLHVKANHTSALRLYEQFGFTKMKFLPGHYFFDERYHDAIQLHRKAGIVRGPDIVPPLPSPNSSSSMPGSQCIIL